MRLIKCTNNPTSPFLTAGECAGQKFDLVDVRLTRDGEDVRSRETNRTVFVNDTITISYDIPAGTGFKVAQFFWMELHHKHLKQFFGKKCWEPGLCSIYWKVIISELIP